MLSELAFAVGVLFTSAIGFAQSLPPAPHRRVVTVSTTNARGNEPSITVNFNNANQVVAAFQPAAIAYSSDGGQTFALAELPSIEGWKGGGDVSVAFDNKGRVYLATLHFDKLGSASYWAHGAGKNGIFVRRSVDGGRTWDQNAAVVKAFQGNEPNLEFEPRAQQPDRLRKASCASAS